MEAGSGWEPVSNLAVLIFLSGVCLSAVFQTPLPPRNTGVVCFFQQFMKFLFTSRLSSLSAEALAAVPAGEATKFSESVRFCWQCRWPPTAKNNEQCVVRTQRCDPYAAVWDGDASVCLLPASSTSILAPALSLLIAQLSSFGSEHTRFSDRLFPANVIPERWLVQLVFSDKWMNGWLYEFSKLW